MMFLISRYLCIFLFLTDLAVCRTILNKLYHVNKHTTVQAYHAHKLFLDFHFIQFSMAIAMLNSIMLKSWIKWTSRNNSLVSFSFCGDRLNNNQIRKLINMKIFTKLVTGIVYYKTIISSICLSSACILDNGFTVTNLLE